MNITERKNSFIDKCKRIFQSFDFRFNYIYNVKTPTLTEESDAKEVANKEYVDKRTLYKSKSDPENAEPKNIVDVVDELLHPELSWKEPDYKFFDFHINGSFFNHDDGKFYVFKNRTYRCNIRFEVDYNDFSNMSSAHLLVLDAHNIELKNIELNLQAQTKFVDLEFTDEPRQYILVTEFSVANTKYGYKNEALVYDKTLPVRKQYVVTDIINSKFVLLEDFYYRKLEIGEVMTDLNSLNIVTDIREYTKFRQEITTHNGGPNEALILDIVIPNEFSSKFDLGYKVNYGTLELTGKINLTSCWHAYPNTTIENVENDIRKQYKCFRWNFGSYLFPDVKLDLFPVEKFK